MERIQKWYFTRTTVAIIMELETEQTLRRLLMLQKMFSRTLWNRDFVLILLISTIATYTNSIFISLLPVYVLDLGGTNALSGMMMTGLTVLGIVTRIIIAPLIDKVGRRKLLILGSGLYALNAILFCFTKDLNVLFALRVLCGFTQGVFFPVPPTMVADISPEDLLVDAMGFFGVSSSITFAVTPTVGLAIYNSFGPEAMFITAAAAGVISFVLSLFIREHYQKPVRVPKDKREKKRPALQMDRVFLTLVLLPCFINLFLYVGNSSITSFLTPCGLSRGIEQISLYFLINNIAVMVSRLLIGRVIPYVSKHLCIFVGLLFCAVGTAIIAFAYGMGLMVLSAVLTGVGLTVVNQLLQVEVLTAVPENRRGIANSAFMLFSDTGTGAGAAAWGATSASIGYTPTYLLAGASTLLSCVCHGVYWKKQAESTDTAASVGKPDFL